MKPILIRAAQARCLAMGLATLLATPLAAQAAPEPPAAAEPGAPAAPAPGAQGAEGAGRDETRPETRQQRQERSAAKLAGLIVFVANSCPEAQPDYDRFKQIITAMGVKVDDLSQGLLAVRSAEYTQAYQKDPAESCRRAFENFGETGRVVAGLIARKAPDAGGSGDKPAATPIPAEPAPDAR